MTKIYKYPLEPHMCKVRTNQGARPLCVQTQAGQPMLWMLVDPDRPAAEMSVDIVPTGVDTDCRINHYVGTFQIEGLVFHVFVLP